MWLLIRKRMKRAIKRDDRGIEAFNRKKRNVEWRGGLEKLDGNREGGWINVTMWLNNCSHFSSRIYFSPSFSISQFHFPLQLSLFRFRIKFRLFIPKLFSVQFVYIISMNDPFICIRKFESDAEIFFSIAKQRSVRERFIGYARGPCPRTRAPQTVDGQGNNRRNTYSTLKGYPPSAYRRRVDTIALYLVCGNLFYFPLEAINRLISSRMIDHVAEKSV